MEYTCERTEGWKRNTSLYKVNSHLYYQNIKYNDRVYLRCILKKKFNCRGSAILSTSTNLARLNHDHNHGPEEYDIERMELTKHLKRRAEESNEKLRDIYDNTMRENPLASTICYEQIENTMYKRRRLTDPAVPESVTELVTKLQSGDIEVANFRGHTSDGHDHALIFYSDKVATMAKDIGHIQLDASFRKVPGHFHQLLTIFIFIKNFNDDEQPFPAFHCLMTSDSQILYWKTLKKLKKLLPELSPTTAICDYRISIRKVVSDSFPGIVVKKCFYQYCRAIWQSIKNHELERAFEDCEEEFFQWVKELMCVPLLPATNIQERFTSLSKEKPKIDKKHEANFKKVKLDFQSEWILQTGAAELSLFVDTSFIPASDLFYRQLLARIQSPNPNLWTFMHTLEKILLSTDRELDCHKNGLKPKNWQATTCLYSLDRELFQSLKHKLSKGSISSTDYFTAVVDLFQKYIAELACNTRKVSIKDNVEILIQFKDEEEVW